MKWNKLGKADPRQQVNTSSYLLIDISTGKSNFNSAVSDVWDQPGLFLTRSTLTRIYRRYMFAD